MQWQSLAKASGGNIEAQGMTSKRNELIQNGGLGHGACAQNRCCGKRTRSDQQPQGEPRHPAAARAALASGSGQALSAADFRWQQEFAPPLKPPATAPRPITSWQLTVGWYCPWLRDRCRLTSRRVRSLPSSGWQDWLLTAKTMNLKPKTPASGPAWLYLKDKNNLKSP